MADDLDALAEDLGEEADTIRDRIRPVMAKAALNVKTQLRTEMSEHRHFKPAARAITYEISDRADGILAEIGPTHGKDDPGSIANIAYFGGVHGGGATVPDPIGAGEAEVSAMIDWLGKITGEKVTRL